MNRRGDIADLLPDQIVYLILLALFVVGMFAFIYKQQNEATKWEDYYAKELSKMINLAKPGDEIQINVQKASEVAKKNKYDSYSEMFDFDNLKNRVCVRLSSSGGSCYKFYNDIDIVDIKVEVGEFNENSGETRNLLKFKIKEVEKNE